MNFHESCSVGLMNDATLAHQYLVLMRLVHLAETHCRAGQPPAGGGASPATPFHLSCALLFLWRRLVEGALCQAETAPREAKALRCLSSRVASIVQRFLAAPNTLAVNERGPWAIRRLADDGGSHWRTMVHSQKRSTPSPVDSCTSGHPKCSAGWVGECAVER